MKVLVTAGHARSLPAIATADLLERDGHTVCGVVSVTPLSLARTRSLLRSGGRAALVAAGRKLMFGSGRSGRRGPLVGFLEGEGVFERSITTWAGRHGVPRRVVRSLSSLAAIKFVKSCAPDVVVYCGGGILRRSFLDVVEGCVVNAHAGPLPDVRGMNAAEWALITESRSAASIHWIDEGIDTGGILMEVPFGVPNSGVLDDLREAAIVAGIKGFREALSRLPQFWPGERHTVINRQCFVMAPALRELAILKMDKHAGNTELRKQ